MKIYNVLLESDYEGEDVYSEIVSFRDRTEAVKCFEKALDDELNEDMSPDEDIDKRLVRDGDDFFCLYHNECQDRWKFRGTIYETELN